jgi:cobalt/nickel transport system permease protein
MAGAASSQPVFKSKAKPSARFLERSIESVVDAIEYSLSAEDLAHANGLLQHLDPRIKLLGTMLWIGAAVASRSLLVILALFCGALVLAVFSQVPLWTLGKRIWIPVVIFTGAISLPAIFLTPGRIIGRLAFLGWPLTAQGLRSAAYLVSRAETAATLAVLLALSTPWNHVLKSLRVFRVPAVVVVILGITYRYIILLLEAARDMSESRQSRTLASLSGPERRRITAGGVGVLLSKTFETGEEVYASMQSRGFHGEVHILDDFRVQAYDWVALSVAFTVAGLAFWAGW